MPGGRPPKPTADLKLHGGLRAGRHDDRAREPQPAGSAMQVVPLDGWALEFWEHNVPRLIEVGLATELDSHALCEMCEWYAEYRKWKDMEAPEGGEVNEYRRITAMAVAAKQLRVLQGKFGMNPTDRVGLQGANRTKADELADLIA